MKLQQDIHLHSREHLLADDLANMMLEPKRFPAYLGIAKLYNEDDLRTLAKRILEKRELEPKNRGKYFFGALKGLSKKIIWIKVKDKQSLKRKSDVKTAHRSRTA